MEGATERNRMNRSHICEPSNPHPMWNQAEVPPGGNGIPHPNKTSNMVSVPIRSQSYVLKVFILLLVVFWLPPLFFFPKSCKLFFIILQNSWTLTAGKHGGHFLGGTWRRRLPAQTFD